MRALHEVHVGVRTIGEQRAGRGREGDPCRVRRPLELADAAAGITRHLDGAGGRGVPLGRGGVHDPELALLEVALDDLVVAVLVLPVLARLRLRYGGGERDGPPVLRPVERVDVRAVRGQGPGFAAPRGDEPDLACIGLGRGRLLLLRVRVLRRRHSVALGQERDPAAVGRPLRTRGRLPATRELDRFARGHVGQEELGDVGVLLPVRLLPLVDDGAAVGRDSRVAHAHQREGLVEGGGSRNHRAGRYGDQDGGGEQRWAHGGLPSRRTIIGRFLSATIGGRCLPLGGNSVVILAS